MKLHTLFGGAAAIAALGCTFENGGPGPYPFPTVAEVALNEHAHIGENDGTNDAINMASATVSNSSNEELESDIGFYINSVGRAVAISTVGLGTDVQATHQSWIQALPGTFGSDAEAPTVGWEQVEVEVGANQVLFTKVFRLQACGADDYLYGKIAIDSVNETTRKIYVHVLANSNCGSTNLNLPPE